MTKRVLITGPRTWSNETAVWAEIKKAQHRYEHHEEVTFVFGDAYAGVDKIAWKFCKSVNIPFERHQWVVGHGNKGGILRNKKMVDLGADLVIGFVMPCDITPVQCKRNMSHIRHMTHGTEDCLIRAQKSGIHKRMIFRKGEDESNYTSKIWFGTETLF